MSDIDDLLNILLSSAGSKEDSDKETDSNNSNDFLGGIDIDMIMKLGDIMSKMNESDKNTDLLIALKPHLREENRAKIDTAVKLFRLISLLPHLKESGLFENLF